MSGAKLEYRFHLSHLAHFSHDYMEVSYSGVPPGNTTESGQVRIDLHGTNPAGLELRLRSFFGVDNARRKAIEAAIQADREFIPALLRAKQAEIERELEAAQRKVEKLMVARDRIRVFTAE